MNVDAMTLVQNQLFLFNPYYAFVCLCLSEREREGSNYKELKKKHKSFYSPRMGGTEMGAVSARGLLAYHISPLTGLLHVMSSELPFFRVEKSESSVSAKGGEKRKKMFRQETK